MLGELYVRKSELLIGNYIIIYFFLEIERYSLEIYVCFVILVVYWMDEVKFNIVFINLDN